MFVYITNLQQKIIKLNCMYYKQNTLTHAYHCAHIHTRSNAHHHHRTHAHTHTYTYICTHIKIDTKI